MGGNAGETANWKESLIHGVWCKSGEPYRRQKGQRSYRDEQQQAGEGGHCPVAVGEGRVASRGSL
ncbi:hypothetical protein P9847_21005 [Paenibacillus chibensis]|uniref:Uncharacterized protein n=1 Tax=Paenibacillus chibensis TaxID=59846 RepID=A0ABU6Q074_9BACL|nr:hypothetical protein [Paenibacillus chibensis]